MATRYDSAIATEIINNFGAAPEMLVQILVAFVERYSYISEEAIRQTVAELKGRCTVIIIAHRLSTVVAADRILVLEEGRIVAEGTHDTLLREDGLYRDFAEIQLAGG